MTLAIDFLEIIQKESGELLEEKELNEDFFKNQFKEFFISTRTPVDEQITTINHCLSIIRNKRHNVPTKYQDPLLYCTINSYFKEILDIAKRLDRKISNEVVLGTYTSSKIDASSILFPDKSILIIVSSGLCYYIYEMAKIMATFFSSFFLEKANNIYEISISNKLIYDVKLKEREEYLYFRKLISGLIFLDHFHKPISFYPSSFSITKNFFDILTEIAEVFLIAHEYVHAIDQDTRTHCIIPDNIKLIPKNYVNYLFNPKCLYEINIDTIAALISFIYFENNYFSSHMFKFCILGIEHLFSCLDIYYYLSATKPGYHPPYRLRRIATKSFFYYRYTQAKIPLKDIYNSLQYSSYLRTISNIFIDQYIRDFYAARKARKLNKGKYCCIYDALMKL